MEGDSDKNLSSEQLNDSGVAVKPQCTKESNEIVSVDEKSEDIQKNEGENAVDSSNGREEVGQIEEVGPRTTISPKYFVHADFVAENFTAYKKIPPATKSNDGSLDTFAAISLTSTDSSPLMMEIGDCFSYLIFIGCTKMKKDITGSSLQLLFIKQSWLDRCPLESEGMAAMQKTDRKNFLFIIFILQLLILLSCNEHSSRVRII